ncbi:YeiH family protein [Flavobacterium sp. NKUCC04_CG]|uniref:YeiH family protein n=1 Tax=Flavobacterium sp. NKUCC04_CG TaxID=2842121 RepID=UPI001C5B9FF3|nr:putative sulfate exporter family transporter [Flavobacterium sp. NKUCC04_CG]MBW3519548.1 putative sulfate exporter family transporter [Flavobacterium sp. NKUCC04_CG]
MNTQLKKTSFIAIAILCLTPWIEPPVALLLGFAFSLVVGHPFIKYNSRVTKILLQVSIVGLGFGMDIYEAAKTGKTGFWLTVLSIFLTLTVGLLIGYQLKVKKKTSLLIASGTAICGGSAIAAISPVIDANEEETSVSLATIFILNSVALFLFPYIGTLLELSQQDFGLWAAIAIHDTSSVVGAAQKYGDEALHIATTVKLARALWIIPISLLISLFYKQKKSKIKIPYFIFLFVLAIVINTYIAIPETITNGIVFISKKGLTLTLFFIGAGLTLKSLKSVGIQPLLQGVLLWLFISITSLYVIVNHFF